MLDDKAEVYNPQLCQNTTWMTHPDVDQLQLRCMVHNLDLQLYSFFFFQHRNYRAGQNMAIGVKSADFKLQHLDLEETLAQSKKKHSTCMQSKKHAYMANSIM